MAESCCQSPKSQILIYQLPYPHPLSHFQKFQTLAIFSSVFFPLTLFSYNNNNGYLERLTCKGPKHTHTHTLVSQGNGTEQRVFEKRKVFGLSLLLNNRNRELHCMLYIRI